MNFSKLFLTAVVGSAVAFGAQDSAAQTADYSKQMATSLGKKWSADYSGSWDYVSGLVSKSLLKCYTQYPEADWAQDAFSWAKTYADKSVSSNGTSISGFSKGTIDDIASGKVLFELYANATTDAERNKYRAAADYLYNYLVNDYPRIEFEEGKGGFWHKSVYPNQMWLDGLYMGAAFYAEYVATFCSDNDAAWDDIALQFTTIHKYTYDPEYQLNYHGWSADPTDSNSFWANTDGDFRGCSSEFWGRGMGWYFAALVDVLEFMPADNPNRAELVEITNQVAQGLARWQDSSGVWYQLLRHDDKTVGTCGTANYLESSASSMFTYAYFKGMRIGVLDRAVYGDVAKNAYQGLLDTFITTNSNGTINIIQSCKSAGLGPSNKKYRDGSANYYLCGSDAPITSNEGKAIGSFIMASLEYELAQCSGVDSVAVDSSDEVRYYNLRGEQVDGPLPGEVVIRQQGMYNTKIIGR